MAARGVSLYLFLKRQHPAIYIHPLSFKTNDNRSGTWWKGRPCCKLKATQGDKDKRRTSVTTQSSRCNKGAENLNGCKWPQTCTRRVFNPDLIGDPCLSITRHSHFGFPSVWTVSSQRQDNVEHIGQYIKTDAFYLTIAMNWKFLPGSLEIPEIMRLDSLVCVGVLSFLIS